MQSHFTYNRDKDVWCLLNKGKSSNNSQTATKVYEELVAAEGNDPTPEAVSKFIDAHIANKGIDIPGLITKFENDWSAVADEYHKRAERVFGKTLSQDVTAYLTVNTRCPYSIENNFFFVSVLNASARKTIMHELWHFYTWQRFGSDYEARLGKQKYNDIKEALTVLLNIECTDLLPEGVTDTGYPQHKELREKIVTIWKDTKDIEKVWAESENSLV